MKIFITGCAGFIGYHVSKKLLEDDIEVVGVDNLNDYYDIQLKEYRLQILEKFSKFKFYKADINNIDFKHIDSADIIVHLAAQAGVRSESSNKNNYIASNMNGFFNILDLAKNHNIRNIVFASSSSVYSNINSLPFTEKETTYKPSSFYGETKLFNENLAKIYHDIYDINFIGLRFFTVYGELGRPDMAYYRFAQNILNKKEITLFNEGNTMRDMTHISDIVSGINSSILLLKEISKKNYKYFEIFNLGNNSPVSTKELLHHIEESLNMKASICVETINEEPITHSCIKKSNKILSFSPNYPLKKGIREFCQWLNDYNKL